MNNWRSQRKSGLAVLYHKLNGNIGQVVCEYPGQEDPSVPIHKFLKLHLRIQWLYEFLQDSYKIPLNHGRHIEQNEFGQRVYMFLRKKLNFN